MITAILLAASAPLPVAIKADLETKLYDAGSARYIFPRKAHPEIYCGFVNAKNRMGAYTGYRLFYTFRDPVDVKLNEPSLNIGRLLCAEAGYAVEPGEVI